LPAHGILIQLVQLGALKERRKKSVSNKLQFGLNIDHVARALFVGFDPAVRDMHALMVRV